MAETSKSEGAWAVSPISRKDYSSKHKAVKYWDERNVPFASNLMIISKQEVWDYRLEALVLMSRLLLFPFLCWFAPSDSHDTASNYIFAVSVCELMVFLIDLSEAYRSVVAVIIPRRKNVAVTHNISLFSWPKCHRFYSSFSVRVTHEDAHFWIAHFKKGHWMYQSHNDGAHMFIRTWTPVI